ncbi:MAG: PHP domain-containing protein, partial [Armatimonadota bacterium]
MKNNYYRHKYMKNTTRVDFHCHSLYSDGCLLPRELAELLARDGVVVASLADHDCIDGLDEFSQALSRKEVGFITGVEITTQYNGIETHLLAYGFDSSNSELQATLSKIRQSKAPNVQSIADSIRRKNSHPLEDFSTEDVSSDNKIDIADAISLVHRAGGYAFLAHPLVFCQNIKELEKILIDLKAKNLDGIEAIYEPYSTEQRKQLVELANKLGLLVSAGTDSHDRKPNNGDTFGIDMPTDLWKEFRDKVFSDRLSQNSVTQHHSLEHIRRKFHWRNFIFHFISPTVLAI